MTESKWQPVNLEALGSAIHVGMSAFFAGLVSSSCVSIFFLLFKTFPAVVPWWQETVRCLRRCPVPLWFCTMPLPLAEKAAKFSCWLLPAWDWLLNFCTSCSDWWLCFCISISIYSLIYLSLCRVLLENTSVAFSFKCSKTKQKSLMFLCWTE